MPVQPAINSKEEYIRASTQTAQTTPFQSPYLETTHYPLMKSHIPLPHLKGIGFLSSFQRPPEVKPAQQFTKLSQHESHEALV